jgi:hypothetical protein
MSPENQAQNLRESVGNNVKVTNDATDVLHND